MTKQYGVYRLYDRDRELEYIGKGSDGADDRLAVHRRKWWGRRIRWRRWTPYPTEAAALEAERRAIVEERPARNIAGQPTAARRAAARRPGPAPPRPRAPGRAARFVAAWWGPALIAAASTAATVWALLA